MRHAVADFVRALVALAALALLVVGVPVALAMLVGWPLPRTLPTADDLNRALGRAAISDQFVVKALAVVCWLAWTQLVTCIVVEAGAWLRGQVAQRVPLAGGLQAFVRRLILTSALLVGPHIRPAAAAELVARPVPEFAVSPAPPPSPPADEPSVSVPPAAAPTRSYEVRPRDDLWSLAETHLGEPLRWRELFELNQDRPQPDGGALTDPDLIRPGWTLQFPGDAVGLPEAPPPAGEAPVEPAVPPPPAPAAVTPAPPAPTSPAVDASNCPAPPAVESTTTTTSALAVAPPADGTQPASDNDRPPRAKTSRHSGSGVDLPVPVPVGIVGAGLLATGAVLTLDRLRRAQQRRRAAGHIIRLPEPQLRTAETALRRASNTAETTRLDMALRALASCLAASQNAELLRVEAVQVDGDRVEVLFAHPVTAPPGPFTASAGGRMWVLDKTVPSGRLGSLTDHVAPFPALVTVGRSGDGEVLVDLEAAGCTAITGDPMRTEALFRTWAMELATSVWADFVEVVIVGPVGGRLAGLDRVRVTDSVEAIVDEVVLGSDATANGLFSNGSDSTLAARLGSSEGWVPTVVFCDPSGASPEAMTRLLDAAGDGGRGLAVVVMADVPRADRRVDVGDVVTVDPPGLEVDPPGMTLDDARTVEDVVATAIDAVGEGDPGVPLTETDGAGDEDVRTASAPLLVSVGGFGDVEVDGQQLADRLPEVQVNVLGPVEIVGGKEQIDRAKSFELAVYLATHAEGVGSGRLKTALWPDRLPTSGAFNSTISLARSRLGKGPDGSAHIAHRTGGLYRVGPAVGTDFDRFEALARAARHQSRPVSIKTLTVAFRLVRGLPFEGTRHGYEWAYAEGLVARMEAVVSDTAHQLAELCIDAKDPATATWAAIQGLKASPADEVLFRDRMRASDLSGNPGAVEAVMDELCRVVEAVEPYDTLHPETVALYEQLSHRRRRTG